MNTHEARNGTGSFAFFSRTGIEPKQTTNTRLKAIDNGRAKAVLDRLVLVSNGGTLAAAV